MSRRVCRIINIIFRELESSNSWRSVCQDSRSVRADTQHSKCLSPNSPECSTERSAEPSVRYWTVAHDGASDNRFQQHIYPMPPTSSIYDWALIKQHQCILCHVIYSCALYSSSIIFIYCTLHSHRSWATHRTSLALCHLSYVLYFI